jgi:tripartite-type tricarboxylate transporter receptor subunit TctC
MVAKGTRRCHNAGRPSPQEYSVIPFAIPRRLIATALAAACIAPAALAQSAADWPQHPVSFVMTFPAGSGVDVVARTIQEPLSKVLGQPIVVEYKVGAAGNVASEYVSRAKPDGYTLVFGTAATHGSNAALYKKLPYDVEADFVPVTPIIDVSNVLTINPEVMDVRTMKEFVDLVKANPGKYNYASTGNGTGTHMAFAEMNSKLGLNMVHVPYKGGPEAMQGVLKGETCCIMNQVQTVLTQYKAGKVRLLGVTTAKRVGAIPEVPTIAESGIPGTQGFESTTWFALFAPKGTDPAVVAKLNGAVRQVLQQPDVRAKLEGTGNAIRLETPDQFRQTVRVNRQKWAEVVKAANITID